MNQKGIDRKWNSGFYDAFLESEVRCGFFVPSTVKQAWAAQLEVLYEVDKLCRKHGIKYFADWGTLIGAVRHGGFVPWDDDLDIVMRRQDYWRFLEVAKELPEGFSVFTYDTHPEHWLFLANVVSHSRICFEKEHLERFHGFPYISGMDIFLLDNVSVDSEQEKRRCQMAEFIFAVGDDIATGKARGQKAQELLDNIEQWCKVQIPQNLRRECGDGLRRWLYHLSEHDWFDHFTDDESQELTQLMPFGLHGNAMRLPKAYYEEQIHLPFEYMQIPVPLGYDAMLSRKYGDYMKLVKNAGAHDYPFFNKQKESLQEVLDFEMPGYKFQREQIREYGIGCLHDGEEQSKAEIAKNGGYKDLLKDAAGRLEELLEQCCNAIDDGDGDTAFSSLEESQQLAVDMGTLLESIGNGPARSVHSLEEYCESVYAVYQVITGEVEPAADRDYLQELVDALELVKQDLQKFVFARREVVFLPFSAKHWETMRPLWELERTHYNTDVYVVPIPYFYKEYDGALRDMQYDLEDYPQELKAIDCEEFDLSLHYPDCIYFQNPYDQYDAAISVAPVYYAAQLQLATQELIYVPYFREDEFTRENGRAWTNMAHYCNTPGVVTADKVYVDSKQRAGLYVEKLCEFAGEDTRGLWEKKLAYLYGEDGLLGIDAVPSKECADDVEGTETIVSKNNAKTVLYYLGVGQVISHEATVLEKMRSVFDTFAAQNKKDADESTSEKRVHLLLWRDDCFDENMHRLRPQLYQQILELIAEYAPNDWFTVGEGMDMEQAMQVADAYYGDAGPLVIPFSQSGHPVMIQNHEL